MTPCARYSPSSSRAIYFAANHRRREIYVGGSTLAVIMGNKALPGLGDWYLARTGYASQQYDGAPERKGGNLWEPADADVDFGTHGSFGARAHRWSLELWGSMHKWLLLSGLATATAAVLIAWRRAAAVSAG